MTKRDISNYLVERWVESWKDYDPRRVVFDRFGCVVRAPCVAATLANEERHGFKNARNDTAFALACALRSDMTDEEAESLVESWNAGLVDPLDPSEVSGAIRSSLTYSRGVPPCNSPALATACVTEEACDYYRHNYGDERWSGSDALRLHGWIGLAPADLAVYAAVCDLERIRGVEGGAVIAAPARELADLSGLGHSSASSAIDRLAASGLIAVVDRGTSGPKGKSKRIRRVLPIPLNLPAGNKEVARVTKPTKGRPKVAPAMRAEVVEFALSKVPLVHSGDEVHEYLFRRGLTDETISRYGLRTVTAEARRSLINDLSERYTSQELSEAGLDTRAFEVLGAQRPLWIPYFENGLPMSVRARRIDASDGARYGNLPVYLPELFASDVLSRPVNRVVICEGELDTMSIQQVGGHDEDKGEWIAVGLPTAAKILPITLRSQLAGRHVVLALDNDEAGSSASRKLLSLLKLTWRIPVTTIDLEDDANEMLVRDADGLRALIASAFDDLQRKAPSPLEEII